ncbi:hypothetical protein [Enterovibrio nigricans]|uniref:Uncharacterized protein n=1 Tax=Enterovibrio nigricans DSM 22720 TaxID=1121868 RepID=A0A1T4V5N1_9GAMM|nr:hypothetical protein [Enterovibrio nigricans]PKF49879.1 hypothetical protein AT251_15630 [Enterovibrio nigricans]SKA60290.1 hypothetical protein SAMN02745132_03270 [Enterovibrio nigricans DSM 22720]
MTFDYTKVTHPAASKFLREQIEFKTTDANHKRARVQQIDDIRRHGVLNNIPLDNLNDLQTEYYRLSVDVGTLDTDILELKGDLSTIKHTPQEAFEIIKTVFTFSKDWGDLSSLAQRHSFLTATKNWLDVNTAVFNEFYGETGVCPRELAEIGLKF